MSGNAARRTLGSVVLTAGLLSLTFLASASAQSIDEPTHRVTDARGESFDVVLPITIDTIPAEEPSDTTTTSTSTPPSSTTSIPNTTTTTQSPSTSTSMDSVSTTTTPASTTTSTPAPTTTAPTAEFPTPETTGSRIPVSAMTKVGSFVTTTDGQIIEGMDITGRLTIYHDDVVVRDSRINYTAHYGVYIRGRNTEPCPTGTLLEHVEIDGRLSSDDMIPVYSPGCEWTLDHAYVHDIGRTVRLVRNNTVTNSYILANHNGDSGSHRGAIGLNGGNNHVIRNNWLVCDTTQGCSAALAMYGDVAPVENVLIEHNFFAANAAYCAYGGSSSSKPFPDASDVRFLDNHFSTMIHPQCGRSGHLTGWEGGVRGNVFQGNVWHESGEPIG